jgi:hypothetical protein
MSKHPRKSTPDDLFLVEFSLDGTPNRILPDLVEEEVIAIGYVTCQWALLEHILLVNTIKLARRLRTAVPSDAKNKSFSRRLRAWQALVRRLRVEARRERLLRLASTIANLESKRHQVTHGLWSWEARSPHRLMAYSFRPTVEFSEPYDADKIMKLGDQIGAINFELNFPGGKQEAWKAVLSERGPYVSRSWLLGLREKAHENPDRPPATPPARNPLDLHRGGHHSQNLNKRRPVRPPARHWGCFVKYIIPHRKNKERTIGRCRSGAASTLRLPTRQFPLADAAAARPWRRAEFPGDMCDETDLRCVCGTSGTAGFVAIRDRGAEDSQAMQ